MWEYLDELIAVILVIGCLALIFTGTDSEVKSILTVAAGWAFGRGYGIRKDRKQRR